jgi:hypothetical protein
VSINVAQLPESYTLTLTLSHTWERGCGRDHHWRFSCSRPKLVSHFDLASRACSGNQKF